MLTVRAIVTSIEKELVTPPRPGIYQQPWCRSKTFVD